MQDIFHTSLKKLEEYCETQDFAGWDPYDGLNSKIFQATPFKHWDIARLAWIQAFKRCPVNLRKILMVPKEHNAKGIALFLTGYCNLYHHQQHTGITDFGTKDEILEKINYLAELLISMQSKGYSGACWGYNFDWQARRILFFPKNTPTVVATAFAVSSLLSAYEITAKGKYKSVAISAADFVINDLNRTEKAKGFLFSYSPLKGNNTVYNASLLGSKLLSQVYKYSKDTKHKDLAKASIEACLHAQNEDGSWVYGELPVQNWIDSFHTGYNLEALSFYMKNTGDNSVANNIEKGFEFYIKNFFMEDGTPKYYHNKVYPVDIHCPAQLITTLSTLGKFEENRTLANKVLKWSLDNMQDKKGYFYYQLKKGISSKIPYMRWSNAFMFYAMSFYIKESHI